jgi:phosphoglycolate phosphatase
MKLVIFDCDGTLVDSQNAIFANMHHAFSSVGLPTPTRADVLGVVGLSLPETFAVLASQHAVDVQGRLAELYRTAATHQRQSGVSHDPLFEGAAEAVAALARRDDVLLGVATGKSKRGVARLIEHQGWHGHFFTIQTADDHPSKPHPSMILRAMQEAGAEPHDTVMVGDTSYDMEMACRAGVSALGVAWGYHASERLQLAGAHSVVATFPDLLTRIEARFAPTEVSA